MKEKDATPEQMAAELAKIRIEILDLSQEDMARRFDVSLKTYWRWEKNGVAKRHLALARTWAKRKT